MSIIDYPDNSTDSNPIVLTDDSTQLQVTTGSATESGVISESGGSYGPTKIGAGTLTLTAANTYTGTTTVSDGTLQLGDGGTLGSGSVVDNSELTFDNSAGITVANAISGTGHVTFTNFGGVTLLGNSDYGGGTTINEGAILVGNGGTTGSITGDVIAGVATSNSGINFDRSDNITFSGNISGLGYVAQYGTGILTLTGNNTYSAYTTILNGTLAIASQANIGSGPVNFYNGTLQFDAPFTLTRNVSLYQSGSINTNGNNATISSVISTDPEISNNDGSFTKLGDGTLTLTGSNTYGGSTTISQGILAVSGDGNLGRGSVILAGGTLQFLSSTTSALNYQFSATASGGAIDTDGHNVTLSGTLSNASGSGGFAKLGAGTLTLTGVGTYTDETDIDAGTLALSGSGSIAGTSSLSDNAVFDISQTTGASIGSLAGNGTVALGSDTLTVTNGTGLIATSDFSGIIQDGGIAGGTGGSLAITGGVEGLTGDNTYTGTTTIAAGAALYIGINTTTGSLGSGAVTDNGILGYQLTAPASLANVISGTGELHQLGSGTLSITAADTYSGRTIIGTGATLALSGAGSIASSAYLGDYGGTFDISGTNSGATIIALSDLQSSGDIIALGSKTLTIFAGANYIFSGVIEDGGIAGGTGGGLVIEAGQQTLSGANTYTGGTDIYAGATLIIGYNSATASLGSGAVSDYGLLAYNLTGTAIVGNVISGSGSFTQFGSGDVDLDATDIYSGSTYDYSGTLTVDGSIASSSGVTVASGATLSGTGTVSTTNVQSGGTLAPGDTTGALNVDGNLSLASGATYDVGLSPSTSDTTMVSGTANIAGTLAENFANGTYTVGQTYTILSSTGALSGTFANASQTGLAPGLTGVLSYDAHDVYLTIEKTQASDFNGDGKSDILLQNDDGQGVVWLMNGGTVTDGLAVGANPGPSWHMVGSGDFNGDGKADILLQNDSGEIVTWLMNGTNVTDGVGIANPGPSWHVVGTGDFNNDGQTDILLQNDSGQAAIWYMNGTTLVGGVGIAADPGPTWHMVGTGDFNGDGQTDILLQNDSGQAAIWFMNGATLTGGVGIAANPGPTWQMVGTGDFNGDGKADILLQNTSGQGAVWLMDGSTLTGGLGINANAGPTWHMVT